MINIEKPKAFIIKTSIRGLEIRIDADELPKIVQAIRSGQPVVVRQGMFNPSWFGGIVEDKERIDEYFRQVNSALDNNEKFKMYNIGSEKKIPGFEKLSDIFDRIPLGLTGGQKRLN